MSLYRSFLRPLLFRLSADRAHELARLALGVPALWKVLGRLARFADARLETELAGLRLANPVGLAPGFDKDAALLLGLSQLGFGYIVVGSITREPRYGNPFPRLVRYPERLSIANSMGLPNRGLAEAIRLLSGRRDRPCPIIASVAGFSSHQLLQAAQAIEPYVEAVEIGLVCPNTTETERLEELRVFGALAEGLAAAKRKPVFVKLPPHHTEADRERVRALVEICCRYRIEGVSVSGSRPVVESRLGAGTGSLAGRDTFADALRIVHDVAEWAGSGLEIKASGGVFSGQDARLMLEAGASTVEVYSALIYRGWTVAGEINRELTSILAHEGLGSVRELHKTPESVRGPSGTR